MISVGYGGVAKTVVARRMVLNFSHNLKVVGSNPTPATNKIKGLASITLSPDLFQEAYWKHADQEHLPVWYSVESFDIGAADQDTIPLPARHPEII
jgi:hypothetical protein